MLHPWSWDGGMCVCPWPSPLHLECRARPLFALSVLKWGLLSSSLAALLPLTPQANGHTVQRTFAIPCVKREEKETLAVSMCLAVWWGRSLLVLGSGCRVGTGSGRSDQRFSKDSSHLQVPASSAGNFPKPLGRHHQGPDDLMVLCAGLYLLSKYDF
jgi:hypothetical protein